MHRLQIAGLLLAGTIIPATTSHTTLSAKATASSGGIGIRLANVPANSSSDPFSRVYIVDHLAPGSNIRRQVEVSNSTRSAANVTVYAAGATLGRTGFKFAPGHTQDQLSSWTSVSRGVLHLAPLTAALETVTLKVPKYAAAGERYAVVWAQVSAPSSASGVTLVNRVGIRMYVSIGPGGTPPPGFSMGPLSAGRSANGTPFVAVQVHNTGQSPLVISGRLTLSNGPGGTRGGPFLVAPASPLTPGASEQAAVALAKHLPNGPWTATMRLTSGLIVRSATARLTFPQTVVNTTRAGSRLPTSSHLLILIVAILLVALAALLLVLLRHRSRSRKAGRLAAGIPG